MSIGRHFDAKAINKVVNDPSVAPWVLLKGAGYLDLSDRVRDHRNMLLMLGDDGGCLFEQLGEPGIYEVHIQFLENVRGKVALEFVNSALFWMFTRTDCMEILTRVPQNNEPARMMVSLVHGIYEFVEGEFNGHKLDHYALRYNDWLRTAPELESLGAQFHVMLDEEAIRLGVELHTHDPSSFHDRVVGATYSMILSGNVDKGIILYNRWARSAGYKTIGLVSREPLVIDAQDFRIVRNGDSFNLLP